MGFDVGLPRAAAQLQRHGADPAESQTPEEQLREVVDRLAMCPERSAWAGADWEPLGSVLVFRPRPARSLHVVGQSLLAGEFRRLIAAGTVPGWYLHPVPPSRTPLDVLAGPLLHRSGSMRFYNILERNGFACVEEVAATPDACLLELRNSGRRLVATVRAVISDLGSAHTSTSTAGSSATGSHGSDHAPADAAVAVPQDVAAALRVIVAWAIAERGAYLLGDLLTLAPATNGMPADVTCQWERLARLSLRPLVGPAKPCENLTQLAMELLGETDERRQMILTSRTFAPEPRTYDSLAGELDISRERVRQLEEYALIRLARAAQADQYAPLRWRAASVARDRATMHTMAADAPPWMAKLLSWLAGKTG
jgi:Sigma-70, region 4